jgi:hypothetical protein
MLSKTLLLLLVLIPTVGTAGGYTGADWAKEAGSDDEKTAYQAEGYAFGVLEATRVISAAKPGALKQIHCPPPNLTPEQAARDLRTALSTATTTATQPAPLALMLVALLIYPCGGL